MERTTDAPRPSGISRTRSLSMPLVEPPPARPSRVTTQTWGPQSAKPLEHPEPCERPDFSASIRARSERWWLYRFLGFHTCTRNEKASIVVYLVFVLMIVAAMISASLIEVAAFNKDLEKYPGTLQAAASATLAYINFYKAIFGFLGTTLLAMLGAVPNETRDEEGELKRSKVLGKIVQLGVIVSIFGGAVCWVLILSTYKTFLTGVYQLTGTSNEYAVSLMAVYVRWACASLPFFFLNSVFRSFYMQTGRFMLVAIDLLLDMLVFNVMIRAWAVQAPVDQVSLRCGVTTLTITLLKTVVYVGFSSRASQIKQYQFFNGSTKGLGSVYHSLGLNVLWQALSTLAVALWTFLLTTVMYQFSVKFTIPNYTSGSFQIGLSEILANAAGGLSIILLSVPGLIASFMIMWKGTAYIADSRYRSFAGMVRNVIVSQFCFTLLSALPAGDAVQDYALHTTAGDYYDLVKPTYNEIKPWITTAGVLAANWNCLQAILFASGKFCHVAISNCILFLVFGVGGATIGQSHDSFRAAFILGQNLPYFMGTVCFFFFYWLYVRKAHLERRKEWSAQTIHDDLGTAYARMEDQEDAADDLDDDSETNLE